MFVKQWTKVNVRIAVALVATIVLFAISLVSTVSAEGGTANTLKVSPVRTDIQIKPGETKTIPITVGNLTKQSVTVRPIENDFVAGDDRGTPALILDEAEFAPSHSLKRFMAPLSDVEIPANKSKTINVTITVPANAQAGGYFGAVRFAPTAGDTGGQVNMSASVASLILLTVPGDIVEKLELKSFDIQQNGINGTNFATPDNLQLAVKFQNKGNVQIGPFGKISVLKGNKVVYEADFNDKTQRDMVLPDSARLWDIPLDKIGKFGNYKVMATFAYGEKNQTIEVTKSFWVVPPMLIIGAIIGFVLLIGIIIGIILLARHNKRKHRLPRARR